MRLCVTVKHLALLACLLWGVPAWAQPAPPYPVGVVPPAQAQFSLKVDPTTTPNRTFIGCEGDQIGGTTVNGIRIVGGAAGVGPTILGVPCVGGDVNAGLTITPAGTGTLTLGDADSPAAFPGGVSTSITATIFVAAINNCSTDVPWSTAANLQPTRIAAGDYGLGRTAAGAETYNVQCTLQVPFRATAGKGWRLDSMAFSYAISVVALTNHDTITLQTSTYADGVATSVAAYGGALSATTLATATQATPRLTTITPGTPAFMVTANTQVSVTWRVIMANTGVYRIFGIVANWTQVPL